MARQSQNTRGNGQGRRSSSGGQGGTRGRSTGGNRQNNRPVRIVKKYVGQQMSE